MAIKSYIELDYYIKQIAISGKIFHIFFLSSISVFQNGGVWIDLLI
jgi:hypothetical protein